MDISRWEAARLHEIWCRDGEETFLKNPRHLAKDISRTALPKWQSTIYDPEIDTHIKCAANEKVRQTAWFPLGFTLPIFIEKLL